MNLGESKVNSREAGKLHVLFLADRLGTFLGGAERVLLNMIRLLPKDRYRCSLALLDRDPSATDGLKDLPCPIVKFPMRSSFDWNAAKMAARLREFIRAERVSIVHTFFETSDLWGGTVAKLSGCPVVISSRRDMGVMRSRKHQVGYRLVNPWVDMVTAVSEQVRTFCIEKDGLPPGKVITLYNGVDLAKIELANGAESVRSSYRLAGASHLITTVANLRHVKGIDVFIRAASIVHREFPKALFLVVGFDEEQEYGREMHRLTQSLGLDETVRFLGPTEQVFSILKLSDVFCLLSRSEGFSNALLEGMACGLPCVVTRVGGNGEALTDNENGFLVESEDAQAAAERILLLLRDPQRARQIGDAARESVKARFTTDVMMNQLIELYEGLYHAKRN
jgi:glycosyltransferase involved in cell wall biosynthesis